MSEKEPPAFYRIPLDMDAEMKMIERKELINAAKMLKENCLYGCKFRFFEPTCPFYRDDWDEDEPQMACKLYSYPRDWDLPEVQDNDN